jgi:predicted XRE-type DNA-binding protein
VLVDKVARAVDERELTHAEAAKLVETSRSRITAILNRNTQDVSTDLLLRILGRLGYRAKLTFTRTAMASLPRQATSRSGQARL